MITITDKAIKNIKEISDDEDIGHYSVRVKIIGFGCAGMGHDIFFDNVSTNTDEVFAKDGATVLIDALSIQYLEGSTIDYIDNDFNSGFKVINPNISKSCGCGKSFGI